jgi:hypothetical protein
MTQRAVFEVLEQVFDHFAEYHMNSPLMQNWGERIFSNRLSAMRVYMKIVMVMGLES